MRKFSPTYAALLEIITATKGIDNRVFTVGYDNGSFTRTKTDNTTKRIPQSITINDAEFTSKLNMVECFLVCRIQRELKEYNALWYCEDSITKTNSSNRKAIKHLIELQILIKTETVHIYIVNPLYIRKGEFYTVINTTAKLLQNVDKVNKEHITDKKPVNKFTIDTDIITPPQPQISYGFALYED